jgi:hypothetical protein
MIIDNLSILFPNKPKAYSMATTTPEAPPYVIDPLLSLCNRLLEENKLLKENLSKLQEFKGGIELIEPIESAINSTPHFYPNGLPEVPSYNTSLMT